MYMTNWTKALIEMDMHGENNCCPRSSPCESTHVLVYTTWTPYPEKAGRAQANQGAQYRDVRRRPLQCGATIPAAPHMLAVHMLGHWRRGLAVQRPRVKRSLPGFQSDCI
jgi:hypothetical protein